MKAIKKILGLENMLSICLFFLTSELKYAYKLYAYKKKCNCLTVPARERFSVLWQGTKYKFLTKLTLVKYMRIRLCTLMVFRNTNIWIYGVTVKEKNNICGSMLNIYFYPKVILQT